MCSIIALAFAMAGCVANSTVPEPVVKQVPAYGYVGYASPPILSRPTPLAPMGEFGHPDAIQNHQNATRYGQ